MLILITDVTSRFEIKGPDSRGFRPFCSSHRMMKSIVILLITVCMTSLCQGEGVKETPCIMYKCSSDVFEPVCGKQMKNGCWEEKIFQNSCYMLSANSCGKANYVACVENKCGNSSAAN